MPPHQFPYRHLVFAFSNRLMQALVTEFMKGNLGRHEIGVFHGDNVIGSHNNLEIAHVRDSIAAQFFLDLRFRELVRTLLADHPVHLDAASLAYFMHSFSETDLLAYITSLALIPRILVNGPGVGLINGELVIPGFRLRCEVFDPVVEQLMHSKTLMPKSPHDPGSCPTPQVLRPIDEQIRRVDRRIDALLLVGGFSGSKYLFKPVDETFGSASKS
ncbi:hypothetical protein BS47DRAFT_1399992 [Hydnum rufescens UP504]|uniref:Uncharacterized protein n=1 Tax=Hydnum rufescens UP504 TaxID=1448309 RepID=A0A9P6AHG3_9AGAM|nr:hypothetical protein BS47DRAFT_1399992 [Hydnum rufescens UP504]